MIELRKLCELKQQDHSHISDPNKPHFKQEVHTWCNLVKSGSIISGTFGGGGSFCVIIPKKSGEIELLSDIKCYSLAW